jgi:hypothetical protein
MHVDRGDSGRARSEFQALPSEVREQAFSVQRGMPGLDLNPVELLEVPSGSQFREFIRKSWFDEKFSQSLSDLKRNLEELKVRQMSGEAAAQGDRESDSEDDTSSASSSRAGQSLPLRRASPFPLIHGSSGLRGFAELFYEMKADNSLSGEGSTSRAEVEGPDAAVNVHSAGEELGEGVCDFHQSVVDHFRDFELDLSPGELDFSSDQWGISPDLESCGIL